MSSIVHRTEGTKPVGRVGYQLEPGNQVGWTFVVGRSFIAALPDDTPSGVTATLAALVTEPHVEAEDLVALLPLGAENATPHFAVIVQRAPTDEDGIPVSVIARGDLAVDVFSVGGSRRFSAGGIRPWLLADFRSVIGLTIGFADRPVLPAAGLGSGHPFGLGTVTATTLVWSLTGEALPDEALPDGALADAAPMERERAGLGTMAPGHADDATIIHAGSDRIPADADTVLGVPARAAPGAAAAHPARPAEARLRFRLPNGEEIPLDQPSHLGRRPRPPRIASGAPARLIQVASPTSAVSGTHLEIRQEGSSVVVTDLGSTNGTIVIPPRGRRQRLHSGQSLAVLPGTTVDIGDGNIIEILPAAGTTPAQ